jgi:2-polyprenyl-3-methyl-5-hydroxy-6-metoxy-1,4-benzoquinol methylase
MKYYTESREELLKFIPKNAKTLLDVGCSSGLFGKRLKEHREIEVWGVEPVENIANIATKNIDKVLCEFFDAKNNYPSAYFDVITFNDSLEHFPDPAPPTPNGVVVASIPNFRYFENIKHILLDMDFKYTEAGILDKTHLRFFTLKSIYRLFDQSGYSILSIEGINPH